MQQRQSSNEEKQVSCGLGGGNSQQHDYSISIIRLVSLIFIIVCHIMQYLNIELAWWFNVGVQIFFCISGFLYGRQKKRDLIDFIKSRFIKILVPYYMVFVFFAAIEFVITSNNFSVMHFCGALLLRKSIPGGTHLWFVSYILLCYVITPLLHNYRDRFVKTPISWWKFAIGSTIIASILFGLFNSFFNPAWISCYIIGYALGTNRNFCEKRHLMTLFGILALSGNGIQIYVDYIGKLEFESINGILYSYFKDYNHVFLGAFIFLMMLTLLEKKSFSDGSKHLLNISDRYSYDIYLVHQFLILGPLSLMALSPWVCVNIMVIICGIIVLAYIVNKVKRRIITLLIEK